MIAMNLPLRKSVCEPDSVNKIIPNTIIASEKIKQRIDLGELGKSRREKNKKFNSKLTQEHNDICFNNQLPL